MNTNKHVHRPRAGVGFWMNEDGSRSAEFLGRYYTTVKTKEGWECEGKVYRTLDDLAQYILDSY
jgi:hypothetical protein